MKSVKVLGTDCAACKHTEQVVLQAIESLGMSVQYTKVTELQEIMAYDVMNTPAVVIDETVVIRGRTPDKKEITELLLRSENDEAATVECCTEKPESTCC